MDNGKIRKEDNDKKKKGGGGEREVGHGMKETLTLGGTFVCQLASRMLV